MGIFLHSTWIQSPQLVDFVDIVYALLLVPINRVFITLVRADHAQICFIFLIYIFIFVILTSVADFATLSSSTTPIYAKN